MQWVGLAAMLLVAAAILVMALMWCVDLAQGIPFLTDAEGQVMMSYQIVLLVVFWLLFAVLIGIVVYEFFFMPLATAKETGPDREIIDGRIVEIGREGAKDRPAKKD